MQLITNTQQLPSDSLTSMYESLMTELPTQTNEDARLVTYENLTRISQELEYRKRSRALYW